MPIPNQGHPVLEQFHARNMNLNLSATQFGRTRLATKRVLRGIFATISIPRVRITPKQSPRASNSGTPRQYSVPKTVIWVTNMTRGMILVPTLTGKPLPKLSKSLKRDQYFDRPPVLPRYSHPGATTLNWTLRKINNELKNSSSANSQKSCPNYPPGIVELRRLIGALVHGACSPRVSHRFYTEDSMGARSDVSRRAIAI